MLSFELVSSSFGDLWPVLNGLIVQIEARRLRESQNDFGIIFFTYAALLSLHPERSRFIGPSPPSRPVSTNRSSETDTVLRPIPRMDLPAALSSNTLESSAGDRCCRESKLDPLPSCGGR